jgi:hypothetical protein
MNTPDQGPKDGDFVAYLAELERHQLQAQPWAGATRGPGSAKGVATQAAAAHAAPAASPAPSVSTAPLTSISPAAAMDLVRSIPTGLVIIGVVFVVAGLAFNAGFVFLLIGLGMLALAVRTVLKAAATTTRTASPAQQVTALLSAHARSKTPPQK